MYFNRYPHCQFANPFCTRPYLCRDSSSSRNPFCPTTHILSAKAGAHSAPLQESFQSKCRNIFCPTTCILSANIFSRTLAFHSQESFVFNHRYPFVRLQEFFLSVCRKLIFSIAGYLSVMLYNFFLSFCRNFSFVQLQESFCKLKGVLSGFVQTTITICFAFILFFLIIRI